MSRRRSTGHLLIALVTALAVTLAGGPALAAGGGAHPEARQAQDGGPASVVTRCIGGPGRLTVAVGTPNQDGDYPVTVSGSRMAEGSTWKVRVEWEEDRQQQRFRRTAVDGSWSVSTVMEASRYRPVFNAEAYGSVGGDIRLSCYNLVLVGQQVAGGLGGCDNGLIALLAKQRDDGSTVVRPFVLGGGSHQRWNLELRVAAAGSRQTVSFQDSSNRWSELASRVRFEGLGADPRFQLRVSNSRGVRCWLRLVPGSHLTAMSTSSPAGPSVPRLLRQQSNVH